MNSCHDDTVARLFPRQRRIKAYEGLARAASSSGGIVEVDLVYSEQSHSKENGVLRDGLKPARSRGHFPW